MFAPGNIIAGKYRLIHLLGKGGMGAVWSAKNEAIDRDVAIKVMRPEIADDPVSLQRFFNEAKICGSIRNPGIVDVLDLGRTEDDSPFLVMELLLGESLKTLVDREGPIVPSVILPIARDVARTIALAHQKGVIHRDLKPGNLFLHRISPAQTVVKVLDFGISKVSMPGASMKATATGMVIGSPAYMSPEQMLGRVAVDHRTDIYALGVILYEALSGRLPFEDDNYNTLIISIATEDPPDIAALVPGLPPKIAALVRAAMEKDRDKRIATMDELADRIDQLVPGLPEADRSVLAELPKIPQNEEPIVAGTAVLDEAVSTQTASMATIVAVPISAPLPPGSTVAMVAPTGDTSVATVALGTAGTFAGATVSMGSSRPSRHALVAAVCIGGAIGAVVLGVAFLLHGSSGVDARAGAEAVAPTASIAATNAPPPLRSAEPQAPEPSATAAVASPPESSAAAKPRAPKTTQPRQGTQQPAKDPPKSIDHGF